MRIRRTFPIALAVVVVAAAVTFAVQLRKNAPPEPARLLPGADGFIYADFGWARKANGGKLLFPVAHDPEYERFIQETGFDFERDLDAVAFAIHYPQSWPGGGTGGGAPEPRFSEVFTGRFDGSKCLAYLKRTAQSVENYNSIDIFTIPLYGRSFPRCCAWRGHGRRIKSRRPGSNPRNGRPVAPAGVSVWRTCLAAALLQTRSVSQSDLVSGARRTGDRPAFEAWSMVFPKAANLVVSASYNPLHLPLRTGVLHLRAEAWAGSDDDARRITDKANVLLAMFRSAEISVGTGGSDADVKAVFDSLQVRQEGSRAVLSAVLPSGVFRKLGDSAEQLTEPAPAMAQPAKHKK